MRDVALWEWVTACRTLTCGNCKLKPLCDIAGPFDDYTEVPATWYVSDKCLDVTVGEIVDRCKKDGSLNCSNCPYSDVCEKFMGAPCEWVLPGGDPDAS